MFMAMTEAQLGLVAEIDMQEEYPDGFEPERIHYREIRSYDRGFGGYYSINDRWRPIVGQNYPGVEYFAKKIAAGKYDELDPVLPAPLQVKELDILVTRPSFIVLSLSPEEGGWTFAGTNERAAVTMDNVSTGDPTLYGGLTYVTPAGVISRTRKPGCTVVYFAAMPSFGTDDKPYIQKFNYIILSDNGYNNSMDPDIRHPGVTEP